MQSVEATSRRLAVGSGFDFDFNFSSTADDGDVKIVEAKASIFDGSKQRERRARRNVGGCVTALQLGFGKHTLRVPPHNYNVFKELIKTDAN